MSETNNAKPPSESSLIADIKSYNGMDPLLPWLRCTKKMETLPPEFSRHAPRLVLLQRFAIPLHLVAIGISLIHCSRWIFVEEPRSVLKTMEMKQIEMKKSLFYQAYALYYEKMKKFVAAEKIYHLGVQISRQQNRAVAIQIRFDDHSVQNHNSTTNWNGIKN